MNKKLSDRDKYFWTQVLQMVGVFVGACVVLSLAFGNSWATGIGVASFIASVILIIKVALDMTNTSYPKKDR